MNGRESGIYRDVGMSGRRRGAGWGADGRVYRGRLGMVGGAVIGETNGHGGRFLFCFIFY